ncbi:rod shape-determining protein [Edaphobacillus lindanitolerans]|uniref:Cell shape-determining protein MreB n=1 Tax=Edaphobacillus lindanitolerans TaxID=550447 RepID=A0A1U7PJP1_9BACI|nr:rod shape-determining protein MreB [Edaphobacillus lindanitolerans]SIT69441.1 rod shape-determining protein MreB [Edaphobacillus lindanitolerans]
MFSKDIGIDLGTANVLIHVKGKGVVLDEPSVVAISPKTKQVLAVGAEAHRMIGRAPGTVETVRPLKDGVIADFDMTEKMLTMFIDRLGVKGFMTKPRILICCPVKVTAVEQKAIQDASLKAGARRVYIEEEPKVAAIGAGMDIYQPSGNMIIDIGGGTTDIAVLSMGGIVTSESVKVAGNTFDRDILQFVKKHERLLIGEMTAELIKKEVGTAFPGTAEKTIDVRGRDLATGLPKGITVTSAQAAEAIRESVRAIVLGARNVLEQTPPELSADIIDRGIMLTGGGALLDGLDKLLTEELKVPVYLAENPLGCVVAGTGIMLDHRRANFQKK